MAGTGKWGFALSGHMGVFMEGSSWADLRRLWEEERDERLNKSDMENAVRERQESKGEDVSR